MENFTGFDAVIEWMEQAGLMDALSDMLVDVSVETMYTLLSLAIAAIGNLAIGGIDLAGVIITAVVTAVVTLTLYVLRAIGLMRIAKKLGVGHRYLAWIPYANAYLLGECAEHSIARNGKKPTKWGLILLLTSLGCGIGQPLVQWAAHLLLSFLPGLSTAVALLVECSSIILVVMTGYCLWRVFREFMDHVLAIVFAVVGPLSGDLVAVLLFIVGFFKLRPLPTAAPEVTAEPVEAEPDAEKESDTKNEPDAEKAAEAVDIITL